MTAGSPFLDVPSSEWVASNRSAFAVHDSFPVAHGHVVVVPRRLIASWWEATADERVDLWALVDDVKALLDQQHRPDGYTIGFDSGLAAGQTIDHLHLHVIPRYAGDVTDPEGGIRAVISDPADDAQRPAASAAVRLIDGLDDRVLRLELLRCLLNHELDQIELLVSFVQPSGLDLIDRHLQVAIERGARVRVLTTDYMSITHPDAIARLLDLSRSPRSAESGGLELRVFADPFTSFHPKAYIFSSSTSEVGHGFVGSNNLSRSGIQDGIEWSMTTADVALLRSGFERVWNDERSRPVDDAWLAAYRARWASDLNQAHSKPAGGGPSGPIEVAETDPTEPEAESATPRPTQVEALEALANARSDGHRAGLVVLATGLGKTWLAAFDADHTTFPRVLFVAHRAEILVQARDVFRRVRPDAALGFFDSESKDVAADVVFATVQTLHRLLDRFEPDAFDYVVVDEFHHASASTYRRVIDHFDPAFLLGLTATPERMDGADLLALCGDNLVYRCDLVDGVERDELAPFRYWGVADTVDFTPIPWRNGRFDINALEAAVATAERADAAHREWSERAGERTLAFCVSIRHAEYMAAHFRRLGAPSVALHSKSEGDRRLRAVEELERGDLKVIFTVDLFNEGVDLPTLDTVLMLRPTESPVVFLQQLGRGLRKSQGKSHLAVVDFVGNHRSFLAPLRTLLSLRLGRMPTHQEMRSAIQARNVELPAGCSIEYSLEAVNLLGSLIRQGRTAVTDVLRDLCLELADEEGIRPSALQVSLAGGNIRAATKRSAGWFDLLDELELLGQSERAVLTKHGDFLRHLAVTQMTRSFKMVLLRALLQEGTLRAGTRVDELAARSLRLVRADPRLAADVDTTEIPSLEGVEPTRWERYWRKNPVDAWAQGEWFASEGERFSLLFEVDEADGDAFDAMVAELVEWRLHTYLVRGEDTSGADAVLRVSHSGGTPIVRLDRERHPELPEGAVEFLAEGERYVGRFVKVALNTATTSRDEGNALPALLRSWFGPSAGHPGSDHRVVLGQTANGWLMRAEASGTNEDLAPSLPHFPTYAVACGAFDLVVPAEAAPRRQPIVGLTDPGDDFLVTVRGQSMSGGEAPIRHGDLVRMRWTRSRSAEQLVGHDVLVELTDGGQQAAVLKRLVREGDHLLLRSTASGYDDIEGSPSMRVVAELVERVDPRLWNPLEQFIGQPFRRDAIPGLFGLEFNTGKWGSPGQVSLEDDTVMMSTIEQEKGRAGENYVNQFESPDTFRWSSQLSTGPDGKRGREVTESLETGRRIHLFVRRRRQDGAYTYCGIGTPLRHEGDRPMSVWFSLLTPLSRDLQRQLL